MKTQLFASFAAALAVTGVFASSAQAIGFGFTTNFTTALEGDNKWKGDIWLDSVEFGGQTFTNFSVAQSGTIIHNDKWTGGNTGAFSADMGSLATVGLSQEKLTEDGLVAALNNLNLNSIIDGEDRGAGHVKVMFNKAVDNILVWERGLNSSMDIQALDASGNVIGNLVHVSHQSNHWFDAGFKLNTLEITNTNNPTQRVGSLGLSLADFGLTNSDLIFGYSVAAKGNATYNGPDWKIVGTTAAVPEPTAVIGLGLVAGSLFASRRQKSK